MIYCTKNVVISKRWKLKLVSEGQKEQPSISLCLLATWPLTFEAEHFKLAKISRELLASDGTCENKTHFSGLDLLTDTTICYKRNQSKLT